MLTRPLTVPFPGLADDIVNVVKIAATAIITFFAFIVRFLLIFYKYSLSDSSLVDSGTGRRSAGLRCLHDFRALLRAFPEAKLRAFVSDLQSPHVVHEVPRFVRLEVVRERGHRRAV